MSDDLNDSFLCFFLVIRSRIQLDVSLSLSSSLESKFLFSGNLCYYRNVFYSLHLPLLEWLAIEVRTYHIEKNELLGSNPFHFISGIIQQWFPSAVVNYSWIQLYLRNGQHAVYNHQVVDECGRLPKHKRSLRVALGSCHVGLLHFFCAWQTS